MTYKATTIRLTEEDRAIAESIAREIGSNMTGAIRYALRETARAIQREEQGDDEQLQSALPQSLEKAESSTNSQAR